MPQRAADTRIALPNGSLERWLARFGRVTWRGRPATLRGPCFWSVWTRNRGSSRARGECSLPTLGAEAVLTEISDVRRQYLDRSGSLRAEQSTGARSSDGEVGLWVFEGCCGVACVVGCYESDSECSGGEVDVGEGPGVVAVEGGVEED